MKKFIWILLVIWLGVITITQFNTLNAAQYNTFSIYGIIQDEKTLAGDMIEFNQRLDKIEKSKVKPKENKPCVVLPQGFNVVNPPSLWPDLSAKGFI